MRSRWKMAAVIGICCAILGAGINHCQTLKTQTELHKTKIYFPFTYEDVENIELYQYTDESKIGKKTVTDAEDMIYLYDFFQNILMEDWSGEDTAENVGVTAFRFNLRDGDHFEMLYTCYGVKNGKLTLIQNDLDYFVKADIGQLYINEDYEISWADRNELPQ